MLNLEHEHEPLLFPIKIGWSAHGNGWAVHAATLDDAKKAFQERKVLYTAIDDRQYFNFRQKREEPHQE